MNCEVRPGRCISTPKFWRRLNPELRRQNSVGMTTKRAKKSSEDPMEVLVRAAGEPFGLAGQLPGVAEALA